MLEADPTSFTFQLVLYFSSPKNDYNSAIGRLFYPQVQSRQQTQLSSNFSSGGENKKFNQASTEEKFFKEFGAQVFPVQVANVKPSGMKNTTFKCLNCSMAKLPLHH